MRILFLCDEYPPCKHGGIGSVSKFLARELVNKGHNVFVCGFYPYFRIALPFEDDLGVKVFRHFYGDKLLLKFSRHKFLGGFINIEGEFMAYTKYLKQFIKENKIDILEIPDFNEAFRYSGPRMIKFPDFDIPVIVKLHGTYTALNNLPQKCMKDKIIYEKEKNLIHKATKVIAISEYIKKNAKSIFDIKNNIEVIYNGLSINNSITYKGDLNNTVVFVGKLEEKKGVFSLLKAWCRVLKEIPSANLLIYGTSTIKNLKIVNELITDEIRSSITIRGFIKSEILPTIYRSVSCAVFPSYIETFGMTPVEAMTIGCPTIFTERTTGKEIITNGYDGLLVDPDNINEIAKAIIFMLRNRKSALIMGRNGAEKVKEKFNITKIADEHIRLYQSVIQ